ncbi:MAG: hypothetical protein E7173_02150 [Firmicutes bacterium]|nr:hypothetical protein [Bacillota bacterium]
MQKMRYIETSSVSMPKVLDDERKILMERVRTTPCHDEMLNFISILGPKNGIDLNIFFHNLRSLRILKNDPWFRAYKARNFNKVKAAYNTVANEIHYDDLSSSTDMDHEFLHAASTLVDYKNEQILCGFNQVTWDKRINIGQTLNEGYTHLLVKRYFVEDDLFFGSSIQVKIAEIIEEIVGPQLMLKSYFSVDLGSVINGLVKYGSKEQILKFLENNKPLKTGKLCRRDSHLLFSLYLKNTLDRLMNKDISFDTYTTKLANYFYVLGINYFDDYCKSMLGRDLSIEILAKIKQRSLSDRNVFIKQMTTRFQNR